MLSGHLPSLATTLEGRSLLLGTHLVPQSSCGHQLCDLIPLVCTLHYCMLDGHVCMTLNAHLDS